MCWIYMLFHVEKCNTCTIAEGVSVSLMRSRKGERTE